MIKTFFDNYNEITIEINNNFYNGEVNKFVLKTTKEKWELNTKEVEVNDFKRILKANLDFEIDVEEEYYVDCEYGYKSDVQYRYIVQTEKFNKMYATKEALGNFCNDNNTTFKLWAPTAKRVVLQLFLEKTELYEMNKQKGIFSVDVLKNLHNTQYSYLIYVNNEVIETVDPYSISVTNNCKRSVVIDKSQIMMFDKTFKLVNNPSIYELSVKYFTAGISKNNYRETFKGLFEENVTVNGFKAGFDYIKDLGVSHIQLMPINSFHTIDDIHNDTFNWGYDPSHFLALKNTYSYAENYTDKINEFKQMVKAYNDCKIGVNIDVVYNHVYDTAMHAFNKVVPYYYYRKDSNGSFCGNDIATEMPMARHYALAIVDHLINTLQVDGIRFDLMGLMDIDTLLEIEKLSNENFMLYGEGWDMPTKLDDSLKSMHQNSDKLPNIGFFNDIFRDSLRGKNDGSTNGIKDLSLDDLAKIINGEGFATTFNQCVNYVECHDDHTLFDKITPVYENSAQVIDFINKILLISRGITFIHSGQELYRTKNGIGNTYCLGYDENNMPWNTVDKNTEVGELFKEYLQLKKKYNLGNVAYNITVNDKLIVETDEIQFVIDKDNYTIEFNILK